jgi:uncharacterized damage-inducible protein DinB
MKTKKRFNYINYLIFIITILLAPNVYSNEKNTNKFAKIGIHQNDEDEKKEFLLKWNQAKLYTMEVIKAMPKQSFNHKIVPVDSVRTFAQQLKHLGAINYAVASIFLRDEMPKKPDPNFENTNLSKSEILKFVEASYDEVSNTVTKMSVSELKEYRPHLFYPKKPKFKKTTYLDFLLDHSTHHRGQLISYLRNNNIKPPQYRFFPLDYNKLTTIQKNKKHENK